MRTVPWSGFIPPEISLSKVDFPEPLNPRIATDSPSSMTTSTPFNASKVDVIFLRRTQLTTVSLKECAWLRVNRLYTPSTITLGRVARGL